MQRPALRLEPNAAARGSLRSIAVASFVLFGACATPGAQPADMTTAGHEAAAEAHAAEASAHAKRYDPDAVAQRRVLIGAGVDIACPSGATTGVGVAARCYDEQQYNPTAHHLRSAERHEKMSRDHAGAGAALEAYEEGACKLLAPKVRASCPLLGQLEKVDRLSNGVRLSPRPGVNVEAWRAHVACHLAFAQAKGMEGMSMCPLGQAGVRAVAVGNGIELTSDDPVTAEKLVELAQSHVD